MLRFILVLVFTATVPLGSLYAQSKTIEINDQKIELRVRADLMVIKPTASKATWSSKTLVDLTAGVIRTQAKLADEPAEAMVAALSAGRIKPIVLPGKAGLLVPKVKSKKGVPLAELVRNNKEIAAARPAFEIVKEVDNGIQVRQLILPRGTVSARFIEPPTKAALASLEKDLQLKLLKQELYAENIYRFEGIGGDFDPFAASDFLKNSKLVVWSQPDFILEIFRTGGSQDNDSKSAGANGTPVNDEFFLKQWYLTKMGVPAAWKKAEARGNGQEIVVAVVDDGVDTKHVDLANRIVTGKDFYASNISPDPSPQDAHGTACAGLIAAVSNNNIGIAGICPTAKIMPIRISGDGGSFADENDIADGFKFARDNGAKILSCSWGGFFPSNVIHEAIKSATKDEKCLLIVASGNVLPAMDCMYPARFKECLAVGALDKNDKIWKYSCRGPGEVVSLVAPSGDVNYKGDIWSTDHSGSNGINNTKEPMLEADPSGDYTARFGGTSAATPMVAGVAALLWSQFPTLTAADVRDCLEKSAFKVDPQFGGWVNGRSVIYGYGRVDPTAALDEAAKRVKVHAPNPSATSLTSFQDAKPNNKPDGKKETSLTEKLHDNLHPKNEWLMVNGEKIILEPDPSRIAIQFRKDDKKSVEKLWNLVDYKSGIKIDSHVVGKSGGKDVCVVPVESLHPMSMLEAAAANHNLPEFFPIYQNRNDFVTLTGSVSVKLRSADARERFKAHAEKAGLKIVRERDQVLIVQPVPNRAASELFALGRELSGLEFVSWAQPDLIRQLHR